MAVVTAAVVTAAVAVGTAAYQAKAAHDAAQDAKHSSLASNGYIGPGLSERMFNRGTRNMLDAERSILDDAIAQGKAIEPEMYRALGLEPIYDRPEDPEFAKLSAELAERKDFMSQIEKAKLGLKGEKGKDAKRSRRVLRRGAKGLEQDIARREKELEQRGAVGRRVVGFKPLGGVADPTGSAGNAFGGALDEFNAHLSAALAGKEPLDPTLKTAFVEKERTLRASLLRQLGPDYENSTAGAQALANFDRERAESFARYNTETIGYYSALAEHRADALSDLTTGRLKNLMLPADFRAELAGKLGDAAADRLRQRQVVAEERGARAAAIERRSNRIRAASEAERQAYVDLANKTAAGVSSAAGSYSTPAPAAPSTVTVPEYVNGGGMSTPRPTGIGASLGR